MADDEDDYGRRRATDFEYAQGKNLVAGPPPPSPIEQILLASGMPAKEISETSDAIVKLMDRMKDDPLGKQRQMVETFMGACAKNFPDNVDIITAIAIDLVKPHGAEANPAAPRHQEAGPAHAGQTHTGPHLKAPEPRIGVAKA